MNIIVKYSKLLRLLSLILLLGVLIGWTMTGSSQGWTKTKISEMQVDEITGLEFPVEKDALVIGVDILVAGIFGSFGIFAITFLPKLKK